jgi:glycosyltransferase involved in cell wall biosynthesis
MSSSASAASPILRTASPTRPRVLHVITGMGYGGAEKIVTDLSCAYGSSATVAWLTGPNSWHKPLRNAGVDCIPLSMKGPFDLPLAIVRLRALIRRLKPDVVHTHLIHAHIVGRMAARMAGGVPVVSTEHNSNRTHALPGWLYRLNARTSHRDRAVVAISESVKRSYLESGWRPETLHVVYNGVAIPPNASELPPLNQSIVTMVGRLHRAKGADLFIEALGRMPWVWGILVGDGEERSLISGLIETEAILGRIEWDKTGATAAAAISRAHLVMVPSRWEGFGLTAVEAMAQGRSVVGTRVDGLIEVVEDGVTGLLVPPESPEALAKAVLSLLSDPDRMIQMGQAGRKRAVEHFSLERMLAGYEKVYAGVMVHV